MVGDLAVAQAVLAGVVRSLPGWIDAGRLRHARTRCSPETWDGAVREGATLSIEDAIAYALQVPAWTG